jgi:hypothetical protein
VTKNKRAVLKGKTTYKIKGSGADWSQVGTAVVVFFLNPLGRKKYPLGYGTKEPDR